MDNVRSWQQAVFWMVALAPAVPALAAKPSVEVVA